MHWFCVCLLWKKAIDLNLWIGYYHRKGESNWVLINTTKIHRMQIEIVGFKENVQTFYKYNVSKHRLSENEDTDNPIRHVRSTFILSFFLQFYCATILCPNPSTIYMGWHTRRKSLLSLLNVRHSIVFLFLQKKFNFRFVWFGVFGCWYFFFWLLIIVKSPSVIRYQTSKEKKNCFRDCKTKQIKRISIMTHYTGASPLWDKEIKATTSDSRVMHDLKKQRQQQQHQRKSRLFCVN